MLKKLSFLSIVLLMFVVTVLPASSFADSSYKHITVTETKSTAPIAVPTENYSYAEYDIVLDSELEASNHSSKTSDSIISPMSSSFGTVVVTCSNDRQRDVKCDYSVRAFSGYMSYADISITFPGHETIGGGTHRTTYQLGGVKSFNGQEVNTYFAPGSYRPYLSGRILTHDGWATITQVFATGYVDIS
jgi:hypothetical protein